MQAEHPGQPIPPEVDSTIQFPFTCSQGCLEGKFSGPPRFKSQQGLDKHNKAKHGVMAAAGLASRPHLHLV